MFPRKRMKRRQIARPRNPREAVIANPGCHEEPSSVTSLTGTTDRVRKVIFLPEEKLVVAASEYEGVHVYDLDATGKPRATFDQHTHCVWDVVQLNCDLVASVGLDTRLLSWRPKSAQLVGQWNHNYSLSCIAKLDDSHVIVGDKRGNVIVLTHDSGTDFLVYVCFSSSHSQRVNEIVVHRDLIVTCSADKTAKLWNATSFALLVTLRHDDHVASAAVSDNFIVTLCRNERVCVYRNNDDYALDFMFSMDGNSYVTFLNDDIIAVGDKVTKLSFISFISLTSKSFLSRIQTKSNIFSFVVVSNCRIAIGSWSGASIISPPESVRAVVEQYELTQSMPFRYGKQVFVALREAIIKDLAERDPFNYPLDFDFVENLKLSEYLALQNCSNSKFSYSECLSSEYVVDRIQELDADDWEVSLPPTKNYLLVKSKKTTSFLVLIDDFFLSFDHVTCPGRGAGFSVNVPGSATLYVDFKELRDNPRYFTSPSFCSMPRRILYHLVRRLVQFTRARWDYRCLCDLERRLAVDKGFWPAVTYNFMSFKIELYPMNFRQLSWCEVGFFRGTRGFKERVLFHSVGMEVFGTKIRFRRFEQGSESELAALQGKDLASIRNDIAFPEVVPDSIFLDKETSNHITNNYSFAIGGLHEPQISVKVPDFVQHSLAEQMDLVAANPSENSESNEMEETSQLRVRGVRPKEAAIRFNGKFPVYNLAYVQDNRKFGTLLDRIYTEDQLHADSNSEFNLESDLRNLGYGAVLSNLIASCALKYGMTKPTISIAEAQEKLLLVWEGFNKVTMMPFALTTKDELPGGQCFLVVHWRKLHLLRHREKVSKGYSGSLSASVGIIPGIINVSTTFNYSNTFTEADLTQYSEVASIGDVVMKISESRVGYPVFRDGKGGMKPTADGLKEYLGAILFVCMFLKGRVKPIDRFRHCTSAAYEKDGWKQIVYFDLPLSIGIVSSTLTRENDDFKLPTLIRGGPCFTEGHEKFKAWFVSKNHGYPVVVGFEGDIDELKEWVCQVEAGPNEQETKMVQATASRTNLKSSRKRLLIERYHDRDREKCVLQ